jgi:hypothetical protein
MKQKYKYYRHEITFSQEKTANVENFTEDSRLSVFLTGKKLFVNNR